MLDTKPRGLQSPTLCRSEPIGSSDMSCTGSCRVAVELSTENSRLNDENARLTAEINRLNLEAARYSRLSVENTRLNGENSRLSAQTSRLSSEAERLEQEMRRLQRCGMSGDNTTPQDEQVWIGRIGKANIDRLSQAKKRELDDGIRSILPVVVGRGASSENGENLRQLADKLFASVGIPIDYFWRGKNDAIVAETNDISLKLEYMALYCGYGLDSKDSQTCVDTGCDERFCTPKFFAAVSPYAPSVQVELKIHKAAACMQAATRHLA
ncbi:hypothetical protein K440DRAFT_661206 [Wilcoxina mikolae CBS 423.85]|nr:hypothetical protein K440DRAFT_661206 [Wilcoxina mikolae CBS 423.85]